MVKDMPDTQEHAHLFAPCPWCGLRAQSIASVADLKLTTGEDVKAWAITCGSGQGCPIVVTGFGLQADQAVAMYGRRALVGQANVRLSAMMVAPTNGTSNPKMGA